MYSQQQLGSLSPSSASRDDSYFVKETCKSGETFGETMTRGVSRRGAGSERCFPRGHSKLSDVFARYFLAG